MKFVCHRQDCLGVGLTDSACSKCGLQMTVGGLFRHFSKSFRSFFTDRLAIKCRNPKCSAFIPAFRSDCPGCGSTLTVEDVVEGTIGPHRERVKEMVAPTKSKKKAFQWVYLLVSALVFWTTLGLLETRIASGWVLHAMLSVIYLSVFLLLSLWLIPQRTFIAIARRTSRIVKLGMVFNYLTALFLLQMYLSSWWARSVMLGVLFIVTWLAAWVFWRFLWPMSSIISNIFVPPNTTQKPFEPTDSQGRNVGMD